MPRYLIRAETPEGERFWEWSTIVDAPVTYAMTEEQLREWHLEEYGRRGSTGIDGRIDRARETGTSGYGMTREDVISHNRAGPNETHATLEEIMERYGPLSSEPEE